MPTLQLTVLKDWNLKITTHEVQEDLHGLMNAKIELIKFCTCDSCVLVTNLATIIKIISRRFNIWNIFLNLVFAYWPACLHQKKSKGHGEVWWVTYWLNCLLVDAWFFVIKFGAQENVATPGKFIRYCRSDNAL